MPNVGEGGGGKPGKGNGGQGNGGGGGQHHGGGGTVSPTAENFFSEFLQGLGLPVTQANLNALYGVAQLEGWNNRYNPLNVVQPMPGSHSINSVGVQAYSDFDSGVKASVELFSGSHWNGVRRALAQGNSAQGVLDAFKQAYTWDPGVQFPMGNPSWGTHMIGTNGGSGNPPPVTGATGDNGGGFVGSDNSGGAPTRHDYKNELGDLGVLLNTVPELKQILNKAMAGDWSLPKFENEIENSDWYRNHSSTARSVLAEQVSDPQSYQQTLKQTEESIQQIARQDGFTLTGDQLQNLAHTAMLNGQTSDTNWLTAQIGRRQDYSDLKNADSLKGNMAGTIDQLQQLAAEYGIQYQNPQNLAENARNIVSGFTTIDTYKDRFKQRAKSMFPGISDLIDQGQTVQEVADPYVQTMSQLLEVDPQTLGVHDRLIRQALQGTQPVKDGNSTKPVVEPLWQFEDRVRNDPRWGMTDNAKQAAATQLMQLGQEWGFAA